jgi:hypothetical protein
VTLFLWLMYAFSASFFYASAREHGVSRDVALLLGLVWPLTALVLLGAYLYFRHFHGGLR